MTILAIKTRLSMLKEDEFDSSAQQVCPLVLFAMFFLHEFEFLSFFASWIYCQYVVGLER